MNIFERVMYRMNNIMVQQLEGNTLLVNIRNSATVLKIHALC